MTWREDKEAYEARVSLCLVFLLGKKHELIQRREEKRRSPSIENKEIIKMAATNKNTAITYDTRAELAELVKKRAEIAVSFILR